ncbi:unnamed protein product, partial [Protopolystoma xenopodis]
PYQLARGVQSEDPDSVPLSSSRSALAPICKPPLPIVKSITNWLRQARLQVSESGEPLDQALSNQVPGSALSVSSTITSVEIYSSWLKIDWEAELLRHCSFCSTPCLDGDQAMLLAYQVASCWPNPIGLAWWTCLEPTQWPDKSPE